MWYKFFTSLFLLLQNIFDLFNFLGLIPHDDGPLYVPIVAVISLGPTLLNYWTKSSNGQGIEIDYFNPSRAP